MRNTLVVMGVWAIAFFTPRHSFAQTLSKQQHWQLLDYQQDTVYGTSVNRAYKELLQGKSSHPVIVAVIDEGVDITHPDLQGHIWTNPKEIPSNHIDDDHNGYTDDVHGWNFLGGRNGRNIYATSSEADREYARLRPRFDGKDSARQAREKDYSYFDKVKGKHIEDSTGRNRNVVPMITNIVNQLASADSLVKNATHKTALYYPDIQAFQPADSDQEAQKKFVINFYVRREGWAGISLDSIIRSGQAAIEKVKKDQALYAAVNINDPLALRKEIIGDNPFDINDKNYGNNIVGDEYADHGSHCSCIIAADRKDGIGIDGIADNVIILPVRAANTVYGDEMDKDVALAIRYAVDNGARIISMSFGKDFSPNKQWVDDAVSYAEKKGILLVHGAGNDGRNIDKDFTFPSPWLNNGTRAGNFINVGSVSSDTGAALTAQDSNYGQAGVDLFAPGVAIYSCIPRNKYTTFSGTSMATPAVAGVAALLLEYYPNLTAEQLKAILMKSVTSLKGKIVNQPGSKDKVDFATLCVSGGVVNAYNALLLAAKMQGH